jgi:hypothetical protein
MCEIEMLQPINARREGFAVRVRRAMIAEPDLAELMCDPMTKALMAADRVDGRELRALLSQVRENLR